MSDTITARKLDSINPANGEVVGSVPITETKDIPAMVEIARKAQKSWRKLSLEERRDLLVPAGKQFMERAKELGEIMTKEMGKPLGAGIGEAQGVGYTIASEAQEIVDALQPDVVEDKRIVSTIYHKGFGVCVAITPWNFPLSMPHWMVMPALLAGNTVILKPSEETPLIAQAYVDILNETLPKGVLQIVHGADDQGKALVDADVDLIAFTGSGATGKKILAAAAGTLKRVILELGGKDPMIVLDDADLEKAASFAAMNSFGNSGQVCVSTERIFVDKKVADKFESLLVKQLDNQKVGYGMEEGVTMGPMVNSSQKDIVLKQLDSAVRAGAKIIAGGKGHHDNFIMPTVVTNLTPDMEIMRDETFGPVACISTFDTVEQAVEMANDTSYGLGASVYGGDEERAYGVGSQIEAGMVGINTGCSGANGTPWVGAKESGHGFHKSKEGHRQFTQIRIVSKRKS